MSSSLRDAAASSFRRLPGPGARARPAAAQTFADTWRR